MKILLSEAANWVEPGRSKIYADARNGILSTEKDARRGNKKVVDTAELERIYGKIRNPEESEMNGNEHRQIDTSKVIELLEDQVSDLKAQLALAHERERAIIVEKSHLLDMLSTEQEKTKLLMLPPAEKTPLWQRIFNRASV